MQRVLSQLRRPFVRDAGVLQLGSFAALGVSFLLSIALARVLGREAYGTYALVVSAMTTISLFKRLGQDYVATTSLAAAYARRDPVAAREALTTFNVVNFWATVAVIPVALLLAPTIMGAFFRAEGLAEPLRLALLPPIWAPMLATLVIVLQCSRRVVALTVLETASNLALAVCGLVFALLASTSRSSAPGVESEWRTFAELVSAVFAGQAVASLVFAALAAWLYRRTQRGDPLLPPMREMLFRAVRPVGAVWSNVRAGLAVALDKNLISLYALAPILLLGAVAPTDEVALLRVALSYLAVPMLALGAISRLLMVKLPELHATQPERVKRFFLQVTATGGALSIGIGLPFVLLAPWVIEVLYGREFAAAAGLTPLLALDPLLAGFGIAAGPIFRTYGRTLWAVRANLAVLALGLPVAYFLVQGYGLSGAALAYAGLITIMRAVSYGLCIRIVGARRARLAA